ncbi:conserved hypothetical protein [Shewanella sediminis HAW-EB3]|uniref:Cytochrome b561 bacterial/Ni-hydrogenase domain-containing protein n=1 Tax=Shewanella sediminis (strain HAW-EB3) TaxID=425104 RepID=A8FZX0_SHESH|nr:cytochrome b/b6 domain-containing protein [Shewanella sediminis]ABV38393.1 conserved hypothetical protein [Shewanella sediminis HAW-EB3]
MSKPASAITKLFAKLNELQHLFIIILSAYLIITSGWILIGRSLRASASFWDLAHVYLGLITAIFSFTFLLSNSLKGKWRQYFPWLKGDFSQLKKDISGLFKGKLPIAGGSGLFSWIEGLGMLVFVGVGFTGVIWYFLQGTPDALLWRGYHIMLAKSFIGFIVLHIVLAGLHLLDFIRD